MFQGTGHVKSQNAMEFLMTYGWSVLIIGIVIAALFQLGVFSPTNFAPKAQPGNCKVLKTGGFTNLEGTCSGVPPQSVAVFNGGSSLVSIASSTSLSIPGAYTVSAWVYIGSYPSGSYEIVSKDNTGSTFNNNYIYWITSGGAVSFEVGNGVSDVSTGTAASAVGPGAWSLITVVFIPSTSMQIYVNGAIAVTKTTNVPSSAYTNGNPINLGDWVGGVGTRWLNGEESNVQIYNTSLDANQILLLYTRGIGAAPIAPQSIVGWWPLNGNTNDYSGNNNNGAPTNIIYTSSWTGGYTAP